MDIVMVEFKVGDDLVEECADAVQKLTSSLVAKQPHFHGANVTVDRNSGTVVNLMCWDSAQHFIRFRDANQDIIGPRIGHFGPTPRILEVSAQIEPNHE